jgi:hypothetical protein
MKTALALTIALLSSACSATPPPSCSGKAFALNAGLWTPPQEIAGQ